MKELNYFKPILAFYNPLLTSGFLIFSGDTERQDLPEMV